MKQFLSSIAVLGAIALLTQVAQAEDWKNFRGPGGQGFIEAKGLPTTWGDSENLGWKIKLPGHGSSSPISHEGKLYVTCFSGYGIERGKGSMDDLMLHLVCIDESNGKVEWDTKIKPKLPEQPRVRDHGYAGATPATDGEAIYVFFGKTGVVKFDMKGKKLWDTQVGEGLHGWGCGTSPVLYKNLVIVNASVESKSLVALDKETGKQVWSNQGMQASWNTPHLVKVGDKHELVVSVKNQILAYDPLTGKKLWNCGGIKDYVCPSIVSKDGIIYAIGGRQSQTIAVKAGGSGDVSESHKLWTVNHGANVSSPVIYDGHLYWVSDRNRTAYCLRLKDGELAYRERVESQPYASSVIADGKIFVVTRRGGTIVLAANPEYKELAINKLTDDTQFNASPIISGNKLFLRSDGSLYCIHK